MKIIKSKNILKLKFKKIFKIKKNYIKNYQIIIEIFNKKSKFNLLICNALTTSHHVSGVYFKNIRNIGWWNEFIKNKNTLLNNLNILCISNLCSCFGSTNFNSKNPFNNKNYNKLFPKISLKEIIKIKKKTLEKIKIKKILICIGPSIGGIQILLWSLIYPNFIFFFICIASTSKSKIENININKISKNSIYNNYNFYINNFYKFKIKNIKGLKLSRIIGHINYLSKKDFKKKILNNKDKIKKELKLSKYLDYQGNKFIKNFNINTYLFLIEKINQLKIRNDIFFKKNYFIISFENDKRFNKIDSIKIIKKNYNNFINYKNIKTKSGHDSFLFKIKKFFNIIKNYIKNYIFGATGFEPMTL